MHFNFIFLVLGLLAVVHAAPLDVTQNKDIGSHLSSRTQPFDPSTSLSHLVSREPNGKVIVAFIRNSGNNPQGLAPPHHPPVPQRVEDRVADYFHEKFPKMQCDVQYEEGTVYMLENVLDTFQIRWRWGNSKKWKGVEIGGAAGKKLTRNEKETFEISMYNKLNVLRTQEVAFLMSLRSVTTVKHSCLEGHHPSSSIPPWTTNSFRGSARVHSYYFFQVWGYSYRRTKFRRLTEKLETEARNISGAATF
ncbi:hypothetical protein EV359DRAFT_63576 [Lentinula novae-zelandiae]|nr:hypothetical protein EV359DRAFT_63576 [Lentinula novae-zelandiae]